MKNRIVAQDKKHLQILIKEEMDTYGHECDLNHIDVSLITDMSHLFSHSYFNGNISQWNVSQVTNMEYMFYQSYFCGNIYHWNVSQVKDMGCMFHGPYFYGDISHWKPYSLVKSTTLFNRSVVLPYWAKINNLEERKLMIDRYHFHEQLNQSLPEIHIQKNKPKI